MNFEKVLIDNKVSLNRNQTEILQINIGRKCNLACNHCHVEAGPTRTENMDENTALRIVELLKATPSIHTVDLTGGAPELNPFFKMIIKEARKLNKQVIDRCNLTILFEPGQEDLATFMKDHHVQIVASLPCYSKENVEKQRGRGVFDKSIEALKMLNNLGYGREGSGLKLDLVYNPGGAFLPPAQAKLEADYKKELKELFDIDFNQLFTITNMPIKRFLYDLERSQKLDTYMELLLNNFNPHAADGIMCRNLVSIGYDGQIYDCDFNQMLEMPLNFKKTTLWDIQDFNHFNQNKIAFAKHCFACTAGAGSSCGGAIS